MNKLADFHGLDHDGETYERARDQVRLNAQQKRVYECIKDGQWKTLSYIAWKTGDPEASVSARLRDLRKLRFGGHTIERRHIANGIFEYRMVNG